MVYAPNAGHGAEVFRVSQAISSMIHHLNTGEPLSSMSYVEEQSEGTLKVRTLMEKENANLKELRLFRSSSPDGDFRKTRFESIHVKECNSKELTLKAHPVLFRRRFRLWWKGALDIDIRESYGQMT